MNLKEVKIILISVILLFRKLIQKKKFTKNQILLSIQLALKRFGKIEIKIHKESHPIPDYILSS